MTRRLPAWSSTLFALTLLMFPGENGIARPASHRNSLVVASGAASSAPVDTRGRAAVGTAPPAQANLRVLMTAAPNPVAIGSTITYTITVTNLGSSTARAVVVTDTLPERTTFVSCAASVGLCKGTGVKRTVKFGSVGSGASVTATLVAAVKPNTSNGVSIVNKAHVHTTTADPDLLNNQASASVTAETPIADLAVTLTASPDTVPAGENVTYTATVTNQGPSAAPSVVLTDALPTATSFVSCVASGGGVCSGSGNGQTVSFASLAVGASATVTLVATVNVTTPDGTELPDTARVHSSASDPASANNVATAQATVDGGSAGPVADLSLALTAAPDPVLVDSALTYTITLRNNGPDAAASVMVTDSLPTSTAFVSCAATSGGSCGGADNARTISFATLAAGDSATVTLTTTVSGLLSGGTPITNRASVTSATPDPSAVNDSAAVSVIATRPRPPDIVLIFTDDQPDHLLSVMPQTNALIGAQGVRFSNYFVSTPLCGPSRATLFTGVYSHNHGILGNGNSADRFEDTSTIATWLHGAGYVTALIGKYMNLYENVAPYIPPGWDEWRALVQTKYYDYDLAENGVIVHYDSTEANYSTTVLANHAVNFIEQTPSNQPLFLEYATWAPHKPSQPAFEDSTAFLGLPPYMPPSYNEADVSDKPLWIQALPLLTANDDLKLAKLHENEAETLLAVDRGVAAIVDALARTGRLDNAVIIFTGDNGYSLGAHRWEAKICIYEECIKQPLLIRAPGLSPREEPALVSNIDLASTIAEFAGIVPPSPVKGRSLVPLMRDPSTPWRDAILLEYRSDQFPDQMFSGVRNDRYVYAEYDNGDRELYDLVNDPFQLDNAVDNPAYASVVASLQTRLQELKAE